MAEEEKVVLAKMASLLKSGATMLDKTCPYCNVPLFRLKSGEVICPKCGQKFILVMSDEEELRARSGLVLQSLEQTVVEKLQILQNSLSVVSSPEDMYEIGKAIMMLLQILETSYKVKALAKNTASKVQG
ncbi:Sjogren's syndrome/scleroderma autoantigen 1 family protein [Infirmifilum uzonense]|uniref:Sjogren's syndrome/scleroderma autoantigen 1 family protein n=1 Tax=Infirmifilum uzonense TaxID=1550241 RepID=UPI003C7374A7